jgi:hypothetical protein
LTSKVTFLPPGNDDQGLYQRARWAGGLLSDGDEEAMRRWAQFKPFMEAMDLLLAAIKNDPIQTDPVTLPPARPLISELPDELRGRLEISEDALTWTGTGRYLDQETDAALRSLAGDDDFLNSRNDLLEIILRRRPFVTVVIAESTMPAIPSALDGKLEALTSKQESGDLSIRLTWLGPSDPDQAERSLLQDMAGPANDKTAFQQLVADLLVAIDRPTTFPASRVSMKPVEHRPRPEDLASEFPELAGAIKLEPLSVAWDGPRPNESARQKLDELAAKGDGPFKTGMVTLNSAIDALLKEPVEADIAAADLRGRPSQQELPDELQKQMLIGRAFLKYHGIMTADEAQEYLNEAFFANHQANERALRRLYTASLRGGLENSRLWIKTRRGTAAPGPKNPIDIADL